ncbi:MAG: CPXCG motif-containing cysteine-rich protein [Gemmatimonadota bacterium]
MRDENEGIDDDDTDEPEGAPADTEALIRCPYCAEEIEITLDPSGGAVQEYVEDCEICCRPWHLHVTFDLDGTAEVQVEAAS